MFLLITTSSSTLEEILKKKDKIRSIKDPEDDPCCSACQVIRNADRRKHGNKANLLQQNPTKSNGQGTEMRTALSDPNPPGSTFMGSDAPPSIGGSRMDVMELVENKPFRCDWQTCNRVGL